MAIDLDLNALFVAQSKTENNSRANYWYKLDDGTFAPARGLNSNQATLFGFSQTVPAGGVITTSKVVTRFRTISFADVTGKIKGEFAIGKPDAQIYKEGGSVLVPRKGKADGVVVYAIGSQGEKTRYVDSGVFTNDGQNNGV